MKVVSKNGIVKDIKNERDLGDYIAAGWKKQEEVKADKEKMFINKDK